jgi:hypothetical protein
MNEAVEVDVKVGAVATPETVDRELERLARDYPDAVIKVVEITMADLNSGGYLDKLIARLSEAVEAAGAEEEQEKADQLELVLTVKSIGNILKKVVPGLFKQ